MINNDKPDVNFYRPGASFGVTHNVQVLYRKQRGFKRSPGQGGNPQFPYTGVRCVGVMSRMANPSIETYAMGVNWGYYPDAWAKNPFGGIFAKAANQSWSKLVDKVTGDRSSLAVAAAEGRETFDMVAKRATGLYRGYKALRKGDFRKFCKELSIDPKRKHRSKVRSAGNEASGLWLEYHFGWSPTLGDLHSAVQALSNNPVLTAVRERAVSFVNLEERRTGMSSGGREKAENFLHGSCLVKQGATFTLRNENLFLAARLGLINPAEVAWELVPFSFVVDWFTGFGSYLAGFTDLAGLDVSDAYSASYMRLKGRHRHWNSRNPANYAGLNSTGHYQSRRASLTQPVPVVPHILNFGNSKTRAATAVSLLTSIFLDGSLIVKK